MTWSEWLAAAFFLAGSFFFFGGAVGLLRFPDVFTRLHALTKADNLGLGFIAAGAGLLATDARGAIEVLLVWLVVMFTGATSGYLVADHARGAKREREE